MKTQLKSLLIMSLITACQAQTLPEAVETQDTTNAPTMAVSHELVQVHQSLYCGTVSTSQWITSSSQMEELMRASRGHVISQKRPATKSVDFSNHAVALISMGQQRSGGYAIKLASTTLEKQDDAAIIRVQWREPVKGMIVTQALTNPCVFVAVPLAAIDSMKVSHIKAVDRGGKVRADIPVQSQP